MKTRRYSEAQVSRILKEVESGMPVVNAAREHGVSPGTIHRWKSKLRQSPKFGQVVKVGFCS